MLDAVRNCNVFLLYIFIIFKTCWGNNWNWIRHCDANVKWRKEGKLQSREHGRECLVRSHQSFSVKTGAEQPPPLSEDYSVEVQEPTDKAPRQYNTLVNNEMQIDANERWGKTHTQLDWVSVPSSSKCVCVIVTLVRVQWVCFVACFMFLLVLLHFSLLLFHFAYPEPKP